MSTMADIRIHRVLMLAVAFFCAGTGQVAGAATAGKPPAATSIEILKFAFAPREITIRPGTTITWTNRDETPHALSTHDRSFASQAMDTGDSYRFTFASEGDFSYFCTLHPFMTGIVHVRK